ncbi:cache domain-containing sensor histidine kinase [Paenibacillus ferrarius]|uniref:cache domain-containing sensor histidine kinase n=1 Tax=Paenibacillus ferrarius TaxID=1469647 RepID=UPI003D2C7E29
MRHLLSSWLLPLRLKTKLFWSFVLLIVLPLALVNFYFFDRVEGVLRKQTAGQTMDQMNTLYRSLEDLLSIAYKTTTLLQQDLNVMAILERPERFEPLERGYLMEAKYKSITNSLFLTKPAVFFTTVDLKDNFYVSYIPSSDLSVSNIAKGDWFNEAMANQTPFTWKWDENYVNRDISRSSKLLTMSTKIGNGYNETVAVMRISVDFYEWFQLSTKLSEDQYLLVDRQGKLVADNKGKVTGTLNFVTNWVNGSGYEEAENSLYIYKEMPNLDLFLVKKIPASVIYAEVDRLYQSFIIVSLLFTIAFIGMTLMISSGVTKPLYRLQRKMADAVDSDLKVKLPEPKGSIEISGLTRTFNQMISDMNHMIALLKAEERKKEAARFQVLLSQTNPHFLMNTLNTIKWMALSEKQDQIAEMCSSLGTLLEASLNSELEMIHLKDELEMVKSFVYIQNFRFKQSFEIIYEIEEGLDYALVPKLSLQPLVENCIQHGFIDLAIKGVITIRGSVRNQTLYLEVQDNGKGIRSIEPASSQVRKRGGIGIANLKERLTLLFKEASDLEVKKLEQGTSVRFHLPLLLSNPYE